MPDYAALRRCSTPAEIAAWLETHGENLLLDHMRRHGIAVRPQPISNVRIVVIGTLNGDAAAPIAWDCFLTFDCPGFVSIGALEGIGIEIVDHSSHGINQQFQMTLKASRWPSLAVRWALEHAP